MPRPTRSRPTPWIEALILSYSVPEEEEDEEEDEGRRGGRGSGGQLKAHVIGVGQMSQSQAHLRSSEGPTGLLYLSDGRLQIPAVLTAAAWEHLQEQEDRESFTSLLNTTVCIQDHRLLFHMASEQTRCRFFLSVGELATTAAGPVRDNTPCCTSLNSVQVKICQTWRALMGGRRVVDSQRSQGGFDLTELLGEWQLDCLEELLQDVRLRLSPEPSTSGLQPTGWDLDRVRYKGEEPFSVPMRRLLVAEDDAGRTEPSVGGEQQETSEAEAVEVCTDSSPLPFEDALQDEAELQEDDELLQKDMKLQEDDELLQKDVGLQENMKLQEEDDELLQNDNELLQEDMKLQNEDELLQEDDELLQEDDELLQEDMKLLQEEMVLQEDLLEKPLSNPWDIFPPLCLSSSSSEVSPEASPPRNPDPAAVLGSKESSSYLPAYQKHPTGESSSTGRPDLLAVEEAEEGNCRKAKRKRSDPSPEALSVLVEEELSTSPPSWLFDSKAGSEEATGSSPEQTPGPVQRKAPSMHSDSSPFSYCYQVSGQNLQDLSRFRVAASMLHWAVKYLVSPNQADKTHNGI